MEANWLPIETAPKDGTRILVWGAYTDVASIVTWERKQRVPDRWENPSTGYAIPGKPTHWMPLPVGPKENDHD